MQPEEISTPEQLRAWLQDRGEEWFTIGWAGDREVYETDGTVRFHTVDEGGVEMRLTSRGELMEAMRFPDLRTATQARVNTVLERGLRRAVGRAGIGREVSARGMPTFPEGGPPNENLWAVVVSEGAFHVGGMTMGKFRHYESVRELEATVTLLERLVHTRGPSEVAPGEDLTAAGEATARGIGERVAAEGGYSQPAGVGPGDVLDRVGHESGSQLFALGTPFEQRSQPPDMIGAEYHRYRVLTPLPDAQEGHAAAWFDQPGGGAMIVAEHPVRWYLDHGYLVEVTDPL